MLIIAGLLIAAIIAISLIGGIDRDSVINDFCNMECKQNIRKKHKFCC